MSNLDRTSDKAVYSVHTSKPDDVGAVEIIFRTEREARAFARDRSRDFQVLSASMTRFLIGALGTSTAINDHRVPNRNNRDDRLHGTFRRANNVNAKGGGAWGGSKGKWRS